MDLVGADDGEESKPVKASKAEILSFREVDRPLTLEGLVDEFELMKSFLSKEPKAEDFRRVGAGSGAHPLKLTTPRAELAQSVLRFPRANSNALSVYIPSVWPAAGLVDSRLS